MISTRTLCLVAFVAAGTWLWQTGAWKGTADKLRALTHAPGMGGTGVAGPEITTALAEHPVVQTQSIVTWRDREGVTHFAASATAPTGADRYTPGTAGTMADYEAALENSKGISPADIERARTSPGLADSRATDSQGAASVPGDAAQDPSLTASSQARELLKQYEARLDQIRTENAR